MSLSLLVTTTPTTTTPTPTPTPNSTFLRGSSKVSQSITPASIRNRVSYTSCNQTQQEGALEGGSGVDRRNVLLGLGGLYGATATFGNTAVGAPIAPPDLSKCHLAIDDALPPGQDKVPCCPPYGAMPIVEWQLPDPSQPLRTRLPAHKLDREYIAKYNEAIAKMKALPEDDPWNFMQQAQIHCTFCNGAFDQVGFPGVPLQIHGSWLFLPWHRYYLYFWEKILGKLIGDPTFAIPFWNWDTPAGMHWPRVYLDPQSPLYNDNRNHDHYSALLNLRYSPGQANPTKEEEKQVILENLRYIHNVFSETKNSPALFMGNPIDAGEIPANDAGQMEEIHNVNHQWCGPVEPPNWDMGNFHTAGRDTTFWGHHGNVDRLWSIYSELRGNKREFKSPNFLNTSFIFYDENRQLVNVKVKDSLNIQALGYTYQREELPWLNIRRSYIKQKKARKRSAGEGLSLSAVSDFGSKPQALKDTIRVLLQRPKPSRSKDEKEDASEVILVNDIKLDHKVQARFDVFIAKPIEGLVSDDLGEFSGSFVHIPHSHEKKGVENVLRVGITNLIDDIEAEGSENLVVSFVPRAGDVTIGGASIVLVEVDDD